MLYSLSQCKSISGHAPGGTMCSAQKCAAGSAAKQTIVMINEILFPPFIGLYDGSCFLMYN